MTMQDSSCAVEMASKGRRAMGAATEIKQPHPHGVDRKGPQHIGKVGDHIGVTSSTDSIDNIFAAMRNIRQQRDLASNNESPRRGITPWW